MDKKSPTEVPITPTPSPVCFGLCSRSPPPPPPVEVVEKKSKKDVKKEDKVGKKEDKATKKEDKAAKKEAKQDNLQEPKPEGKPIYNINF